MAAPGSQHGALIERLAPCAVAISAFVDPAVAMAVPYEIRAANYAADNAAGDRADGSGNDGAGAGTDGDAFQRSGLSGERHSRQHQREHSSLDRRAHSNLLG